MPTSPPQHRPAGYLPRPEVRQIADQARGSSTARGYDRTWQKLRKVILARDPLCVLCFLAGSLKASEQVDHIIPIAERPELRLDPANLRGLCASCHSKVTAASQRSR